MIEFDNTLFIYVSNEIDKMKEIEYNDTGIHFEAISINIVFQE